MKLLRDLLLGFMKIHILHHAHIEPIYGTGISQELEEHGYELSWGTLYPLLHALEADGLLAREDRLVDGKIRKYYSITAVGREVLREATEKAAELADEIVNDETETRADGPKTTRRLDEEKRARCRTQLSALASRRSPPPSSRGSTRSRQR